MWYEVKRCDARYSSSDSDSYSEWDESTIVGGSCIFVISNSNKRKIEIAKQYASMCWFIVCKGISLC